ncbi:MAG: SHOCT domain-containing protein [Candidatus Palauibacterales bacterium]|nr:SHOCT domain-containing protein [Candidatus Palauibacterales bacterium]MDP2528343.1 SHOCT domain-containing protein [Candidatus Palauibacterales bacterium]MDP2584381.1 SHOCT domain-containing protein [Candidatus Palauibacterales bacterium]
MAVLATPALAALQAYGHRGFQGMMGGWGWGFGILGMLFWLALIVLVVVLVWRLMERGGRGDSRHEGARETPLEILKKRYARGEIDRDEFERMKRDLG